MTTATQLYSLRAGRLADVSTVASLYTSAFAHDRITDIMFPSHRTHPRDYHETVRRLIQTRAWMPEYSLTVLVDRASSSSSSSSSSSTPVGFALWRRPESEVSFYERWLSPYAWFAYVVRRCLALRDYLLPTRTASDSAGAYVRVMDTIEPGLLNTDRRRQAWYLSSIALSASAQGKGLGGLLLRDGLQRAEAQGRAAWLVALAGVDKFYERHGFVEVARANVGELQEWNGGAIMFRE